MRKILFFSVCIFSFCSVYVWAQEAEIIDLKGKVSVRKNATSAWEEARVYMILTGEAEIRTKGRAGCILSFDREEKNVLNVQDNTTIKIESILPGNVFLPRGKVLALIKGEIDGKKFNVKTPTAIVSARGAGWQTKFDQGQTTVSCFDEKVSITSVDKEGKMLGEKELFSGFEIETREDVGKSEARKIGLQDQYEWEKFVKAVEEVVSELPPLAPEAREIPETMPVNPPASENPPAIIPQDNPPPAPSTTVEGAEDEKRNIPEERSDEKPSAAKDEEKFQEEKMMPDNQSGQFSDETQFDTENQPDQEMNIKDSRREEPEDYDQGGGFSDENQESFQDRQPGNYLSGNEDESASSPSEQ